jgi:hypothetical protein
MAETQRGKVIAGPTLAKSSLNRGYQPKQTVEEKTMAGRVPSLLGRAAAARSSRNESMPKQRFEKTRNTGPETIIFEGIRASIRGGKRKDRDGAEKSKRKPSNNKRRRAERVARWKDKQVALG